LQHTKERQAAGIAVAKEKGIYTGRKKGSLKAKPERARELNEKGLNAKEIANALNVSERTVFRYLSRYSKVSLRPGVLRKRDRVRI
jgi:DNA invertase Pin-like site-specific DNA recombinase